MEILTLESGLKVVLETRKGAGLVSIDASVNAGYAYEKKDKKGLASLVSRVITKKTEQYSKQEVLNLTEGEGGELSSSVDMEYSDVNLYLHSVNIEQNIKVLASILKTPSFEEEEIIKQKDSLKSGIKHLRDNPSAYVGNKVLELAFEGQVYGNSILSQEDSIDNVTRDNLVEFFNEHYTAKNIVISIVGDIDISAVKKMCEENFSDMNSGEVKDMPEAESKQFYLMEEDNNVDQVNLKLCFKGIGWNEPDYIIYKMLINTISVGMSSRMFKAMREDDQLVYSFNITNMALYGGGLFCMNAGTGKGKTEILVPKAMNEVKKFIETITDEEVESSITAWEKKFKTRLCDLNAISAVYSYELLKFGFIETSQSLQDKLKKITKEDLLRVANDILNSEASFIGKGPKDGVYSLSEIKSLREKEIADINIVSSIIRANKTSINPNWLPVSNMDKEYGEYKETVLDNGLRIVSQYRPDTLVACGYWIGTGGENETKEENGISHMLEHMVFKGTPNFKVGEIDNFIEKKLSGYLNAFTSEGKTCYYSYNISPSDVKEAMHALGDMVFHPTLSDVDFNGGTKEDGSVVKDGEKEVVFEEINMGNDSPVNLLWYNILKIAYGDTALGRRLIGTKESLTPMSGSTLKQYHDKWYVPNNITCIAIGEVDHDELVNQLNDMWGGVPARDFTPVLEWDYIGGELNTNKPEKEMSFLAVGFNAVNARDEDALKYEILSYILGEGKGSVLYQELVEERQLTSNVSTYLESMKNAGVFLIMTNCKHENVDSIKTEVFSILENLTITDKELKSAVLSIKSDKKSELLSPSDTFLSTGYSLMHTGKVETFAELEAKLDVITSDDLNELLSNVLKSKPTISVVGKLD